MDLLQAEVQEKLQGVDKFVIDTENDHNTQETAKRVFKMYTPGNIWRQIPRRELQVQYGLQEMYTLVPTKGTQRVPERT